MTAEGQRNGHALERIIDETVRAKLGEIVDSVTLRFEDDQQGDPAIYVDVFLNERAPDSLGPSFIKTLMAVWATLEARGETRFPYLATKRPDDEYPERVAVTSRRRRA